MTGAPPCSIGYMLLYQCVFSPRDMGMLRRVFIPLTCMTSHFREVSQNSAKTTEIQKVGHYPLVNVYKKLWKITTFNGKTHDKGPCSIANCYFTRGGSNCYGQKKICELQHKKSSFSHRNPFIKSSNPIQKTMGMCRKNPNVPNRMMILNDHIQSKL